MKRIGLFLATNLVIEMVFSVTIRMINGESRKICLSQNKCKSRATCLQKGR